MAEFGDLVRPEVAARKALAHAAELRSRRPVDELVRRGRRYAMRIELRMIGATRTENGDYVVLEPHIPIGERPTCKRGHPVNETNIYRSPTGLRVCRACSRQRWAEKRAARLALPHKEPRP